MAEIKNVSIFAEGTWNGFKFVQEDLFEIIKNTNSLIESGKQKYPQIKLGHSTNQILQGQSDGDPSLGTVKNFRTDGKRITADFENVPEILMTAIEKGLWKQVSVEMKHIESVGWIITAVAILGADIPAVKKLDDIKTLLADPAFVPVQNQVLANALSFSEPFLSLSVGLETQTKKSFDEVKMSEQEKALQEKIAKLEKEKMELETKNLSFAEKEKEMQFNAKKDGILASFSEDVKAGKMAPAFFEKLKAHLESQKANFSVTSNLSISTDLMKELALSYSALPKGEQASDSVKKADDKKVTPDIQLSEEIHKVMGSSGKNYLEAQHLVFMAKPELMKSYHQFNTEYHAGRA